ncbi:MAG TPA: hypothetical protein VIE36_23015 [Methylomirabilota bacterium]
MTRGPVRTIAMLTALTLGTVAPALAQKEPTLSDIAACNEQAAARTGSSALPHPGSRSTEAARRAPGAPPRGDAASPGVVPGPTDPGVGRAPLPGTSVPTPGTGGPGEKTDPSGSVITQTPDPLVRGMDAGKADDPQYRAAYRDCMRAKLTR